MLYSNRRKQVWEWRMNDMHDSEFNSAGEMTESERYGLQDQVP